MMNTAPLVLSGDFSSKEFARAVERNARSIAEAARTEPVAKHPRVRALYFCRFSLPEAQ